MHQCIDKGFKEKEDFSYVCGEVGLIPADGKSRRITSLSASSSKEWRGFSWHIGHSIKLNFLRQRASEHLCYGR